MGFSKSSTELTFVFAAMVAAIHLMWCIPAMADLPLFSGTPELRGRIGNFTEVRGISFQVAHELTVTGLAKSDGNLNGILDDLTAPQIGIWNSDTSELLVSTFLDADHIHRDGMFVKPIEPFQLSAGNYTVGAQYFTDGELYNYRSEVASSATIHDLINFRRSGTDFEMPIGRTRQLGLGANLVIEQPPLTLSHPAPSIIQRGDDNRGLIRIEGAFDPQTVNTVEVRAVPVDGNLANATGWQTIATSGSQFNDAITVNGGLYRFEVRGRSGDDTNGSVIVPQLGVGEVFVIAGQSNSANHGQTPLQPEDDRVFSMDGEGVWRRGADPQPVASGHSGSPWPVFGDLMVDALGVPVGVASVGWGGTSVSQWVPGASGPDRDPLYDRLQNALELLGPNGARAVLWHQGEQDAVNETSSEDYAASLGEVIEQSRIDVGFDIPWGVARAAFLPQTSLESETEIHAGQQLVIDADPLVFAGPFTDDLIGSEWRYDAVHFNEAGLRVHAQRWADATLPRIVPEPTSIRPLICWVVVVFCRRRRLIR